MAEPAGTAPIVVASLSALTFAGCESVSGDPIQLVAIVIGVASGLAFWLHVLKDW